MKFDQLYRLYQDIHRMAIGCLEKLPEDKLNFKTHPELRTPAELFYHMYVNQDWYLRSIGKGGLDPGIYRKLMNSVPNTKADLKKYIDDVFERSQAFLRNNANASIVCASSEGERTAYDLMLSDFGIQYYHLGQIFAVFRLIDLSTPDYGMMLRPTSSSG